MGKTAAVGVVVPPRSSLRVRRRLLFPSLAVPRHRLSWEDTSHLLLQSLVVGDDDNNDAPSSVGSTPRPPNPLAQGKEPVG